MAVTEESIKAHKDALTALGWAIRGDWSEIDGRSLRLQLEESLRVLDGEMTLADFLGSNGVCVKGEKLTGHWTHHCDWLHK